MSGRAAIKALGAKLPKAAAAAGMIPAELTEALESDPALQVTSVGSVVWVDEDGARA